LTKPLRSTLTIDGADEVGPGSVPDQGAGAEALLRVKDRCFGFASMVVIQPMRNRNGSPVLWTFPAARSRSSRIR
jgi:hypothetical protein